MFSNNKKHKSSIAQLQKEENIITKDIDIAEILNNHSGTVFTSENLKNVSEGSCHVGKINEQVINKGITNFKLPVSRAR